MSPTFSILPLELVELALEEVYLMEEYSIYRCTLVRSRWTNCSLKLLYQNLSIESQDRAKRLADAPGLGVHATERMRVGHTNSDDDFEWSDYVSSVGRACSTTLRSLGFQLNVINIPTGLFCDSPFPSLRKLILGGSFLHSNLPISPSQVFSLSLTSLFVCLPRSVGSGIALESVVKALLGVGNAKEVQLAVFNPTCLEELRPLVSHIKTVVFLADPDASISDILDFVSTPSIQNLGLHFISNAEIEIILQHTTSNLRCLEFDLPSDSHDEWMSLLSKNLSHATFPRLEQLRILQTTPGEFEAVEGAVSFVKNLGGKGITVRAMKSTAGFPEAKPFH